MPIDVVSPNSSSPGWAPIQTLASLIVQTFDGQSSGLMPYPSRMHRMWNLRPRRKGTGNDVLLALLYQPADIRRLRYSPAFWNRRYRAVVVWIIDSFREQPWVRQTDFRNIDLVCITRSNEYDYYRRLVGDRLLALNWGADVLGRQIHPASRPVDVQRMGRQPLLWDNDDVTRQRLAAACMTFAGRPPMHDNPYDNQQEVFRTYEKAKFVLAHSNLVDQTKYTHKTKEYVTGRWTDALACGCSLAGVQPRSDNTFRDLLWPEATLDFGRIDPDHNIAALREAVTDWTPEKARHNYLMSLSCLDWRHSLKKIADKVSINSDVLNSELSKIDQILKGNVVVPKQASG